MRKKAAKLIVSDFDALLSENVPYQTGSVRNLDLAKFGCAVYLFFDFVKFMLWFFVGISLASLCAVYFNNKGTLWSTRCRPLIHLGPHFP